MRFADYGAHSLRAGLLTSAARGGAGVFKMRDVSRHKSMEVLQGYVRDADMFRDHAGAGLLRPRALNPNPLVQAQKTAFGPPFDGHSTSVTGLGWRRQDSSPVDPGCVKTRFDETC
jgi:hypothetical protein